MFDLYSHVFKPEVATSHYCYFHVNGSIGIVQKIDFEIRPDVQHSKRQEKWFWTIRLCVCLSVRPSDRLSCYRFSRELSRA